MVIKNLNLVELATLETSNVLLEQINFYELKVIFKGLKINDKTFNTMYTVTGHKIEIYFYAINP